MRTFIALLLCCSIFTITSVSAGADVILAEKESDFNCLRDKSKPALVKLSEWKLLTSPACDKVVKGLWTEELLLAGLFGFIIAFEYGRKFSIKH